MAVLPAQPHLDHLRRQARDLLRAARAGDAAAADRISAVSGRLTLAAAQLALAREYGFASWALLKAEVQARTADLARLADEFCQASIRDWTGRAVRMLGARPELAGFNLATAVVLGDADRVRAALETDPSAATRTDDRTSWTALHAVCGSQWHKFDPARADGLTAVARLLLDAGADPGAEVSRGGWTPLRCAVAGAANPRIAELLLERGAVPSDHDLYLAGFGDDDHQCLRLLLGRVTGMRELARMALSAPISLNDTEGVRLLLEAGADPASYVHDDDDDPCPVVYAAVRADCAAELVDTLLIHGAKADAAGPDGRSPYALAVSKGRADLAAMLRGHGAAADATSADEFLSACLRADWASARRLAAAQPSLSAGLTSEQQAAALAQAALAGNAEAIRLMLDAGFAMQARTADDGGSALHHAGYAGSADVVRLLIDLGADIEARDRSWDDTPLGWAIVGSGQRPDGNPAADWPATVRTLIEAGAATAHLTIDPDDQKPPSPAVADVLRAYGVRDVARAELTGQKSAADLRRDV